MTLDEVGPEQQPAHLDGIGGARGARDRAHERLVGVADVRVHHVEVALVDRHVDRLAHRAARVVQPGRGIGELDEVAEVLERAVAAPAVEVRHERRAVSGGKQRVACADLDAPRGIARVLGEFARCRSAHDFARQTPRHVHPPLAADARAGCAPQADGLEVAADLEADLIQQLIGVARAFRRATRALGRARRGAGGSGADIGSSPRSS